MLSVFKKINNFAERWKALDSVAIFFARVLPYIMVVFLLCFALVENNYKIFIYPIICGLFSRFIINELVHLFYKEIRPANFAGTKVLIPVPKNYSFPSGHASFFFGVSFMLFFYNIQLAIIFVVCSSVIGIARVFSGVHWFRDILAGVLAGFLSALIIYYLLNNIKI